MEELEDLSIAEADVSHYVPGEDSGDSSEEEDTDDIEELRLKSEKLNEFLNACGRPGIPRQTRTWERANVRLKQRYLQSGRFVIESALKTLQPTDPGSLWEELKHSPQLDASLGIDMKGVDPAFMEALAEAYNNAATWDTRLQILSSMADLVPLDIIQKFLPGITKHRFTSAREHEVVYGRGAPVPVHKSPRMRVTEQQLDHFLDFIVSPHIVQDLPFGQKHLKLSSGKVLENPECYTFNDSRKGLRSSTSSIAKKQDSSPSPGPLCCEFYPLVVQQCASPCKASTTLLLKGQKPSKILWVW